MFFNDAIIFSLVIACLFFKANLASDVDLENFVDNLSTDELQSIIKNLDYLKKEYRNEPEDYYYDEWAMPKINTRSMNKDFASKSNDMKSSSGGSRSNKAVLPAYCDPPNPCPIGYNSNDGCIDDFENTSDYSREYQATQNCLCDSEHMFNCPEENIPEDIFARLPDISEDVGIKNPFFAGQKLPIAAKKGFEI